MTRSNRRNFCRVLAGGAAGLSLAYHAPGAFGQSAASGISVTKITDNYTLLSGAGSNVLVLTQPEGALLVDGGTAERSADLLKAVADIAGGKPVQALFNTCWHLDNTGSNDVLGKAGTKIIAHENTKLWMGTTFHVQWQNKTYTPRAKEARPNQTFYTTGKMTFGKEDIQYGHLGQAHTDSDIYVFFPGPNILVTGNLFTVGKYPILDWSTGGWIGGATDAGALLAKLTSAQTKVIPGSGPVQTQADLKDLADMLLAMRIRVVDLLKKGMSSGDMYRAAPTKDFDAKWGDPKQFMANIYPGLWNHVRELGGLGSPGGSNIV
jgi:glyoxylase-like metal-dependent hydrolase (beta-lactamase superfamily II)